jgi:alkylation response protein AidB-like acyl-CoA dehydrogenase
MSLDYVAPLRDIDFVLNHICDLEALSKIEAYEHSDPSTVGDLLAEAGRFMSETIAPLNAPGDLETSIWHDDNTVTTPAGFINAYHQYVEAGWGAVPFAPGYGGGGFPWLVGLALQEILSSANLAFSMAPLLTQGAIDLLSEHADETQQMQFLPKMITGEWTGTMNLTEPQAGSDVGAVRTMAVPQPDGTYKITGTKIFISFGEHDMAENIIHLVLARTPDAPPGTKGISCFIVPKVLVNDDGSLGARNDVKCVSIEHKMGIKASPTCVLNYGDDADGAVGYLIGQANHGMSYMFTMMNQARLSVGLEGLALSERSYQQALAFAQERQQGRAIGAPAGTQSVIIEHADVRRMLLTMKSSIEAMRRLTYTNAEAMDLAHRHPDADVREHYEEIAQLLTPLSKGWSTDVGNELTGIGIQIHGGMGFIEETGVAQHYRDARITTIYEGTNGIQAMDLVGRKLPMRAGGVIADHFARIDAEIAALESLPDFAATRAALITSLAAAREATQWILEHAGEPKDVLAGATPYLRLVASVTAGALMARSGRVAAALGAAADTSYDAEFLQSKIVSARFFCEQLMPASDGLVASVTAGDDLLFALDPAAFAR